MVSEDVKVLARALESMLCNRGLKGEALRTRAPRGDSDPELREGLMMLALSLAVLGYGYG